MEVINDLGDAKEASDVEMDKQTEEEPAQVKIFNVIRVQIRVKRKKKKLASMRRNMKLQLWTERENQLFYEGLERYGKDWKKVAKHIGSRNRPSVVSYGFKQAKVLAKNLDHKYREKFLPILEGNSN